MQRVDLFEKTLMLGKIKSKRRRGQQMMRYLDRITDSVDMNLRKLWKLVKVGQAGMLQSTRLQRVGHNLATEQGHHGRERVSKLQEKHSSRGQGLGMINYE